MSKNNKKQEIKDTIELESDSDSEIEIANPKVSKPKLIKEKKPYVLTDARKE